MSVPKLVGIKYVEIIAGYISYNPVPTPVSIYTAGTLVPTPPPFVGTCNI
jgi:hypothetical protein